jgi:hypothetical protein
VSQYQVQRPKSSWAIGYTYFAAVLMIMLGFFQFFTGLVALVDKSFYVVGRNYTYKFSVTSWGWIHIILGIVVLLAGFGLLSGNVLARTVAVILAALSAVAYFLWLPYYPVWSIVVIAFNLAVIWALTLHGRDIAAD